MPGSDPCEGTTQISDVPELGHVLLAVTWLVRQGEGELAWINCIFL